MIAAVLLLLLLLLYIPVVLLSATYQIPGTRYLVCTMYDATILYWLVLYANQRRLLYKRINNICLGYFP